MQAQRVLGFATAGANVSQIDGDEVSGFYKWGFHGGIGAYMPLAEKGFWSNTFIQMETLFEQKGSYENDPPILYNVKFNYATVPVLFGYADKRGGLTGAIGLSYGYMFNYSGDVYEITPYFVEQGYPVYLIQRPAPDFIRSEFSFLADVRFTIWKQLKFNVRYSTSLIPIRRDVVYETISGGQPTGEIHSTNWYNHTLTVRLMWVFNEKQPVKKKTKTTK